MDMDQLLTKNPHHIHLLCSVQFQFSSEHIPSVNNMTNNLACITYYLMELGSRLE